MRGFIGLYGEHVMASGREVTMLWRPERRQADWGLVVLLSAVWLIGQAAAWLWAAWSMVSRRAEPAPRSVGIASLLRPSVDGGDARAAQRRGRAGRHARHVKQCSPSP